MSTIQTLYPSTSSTAISISLVSLASDSNLLAGQASAFVDNTTTLDLDHLVSGRVQVGSSPTASTSIEVWCYAAYKFASGSPTYPDSISGSNSAKTMTSANVKNAALRLVETIVVDGTSNRGFFIAPTSIAQLFGAMPKVWGLFVVQNTGAALDTTGHEFLFERIQGQTV